MIPLLFKDLMTLCDNHEEFYFVDQEHQTDWYRIFNYRLASYQHWLLRGALECRGITFLLDAGERPLDIVSRPFEKFFNLYENPFTMDLDLDRVVEILDKMDGSIISSVATGSGFIMKSKGSLSSDQAIAANTLIRTKEYALLHDYIWDRVNEHRTVIMEYVGPTNRIVLSYEKPALVVLGVRCNITGAYTSLSEVMETYPAIAPFLVKSLGVDEYFTADQFVDRIPYMTGVEGYVLELDSGLRVKVKTMWYVALHRLKDSINSQRRLFEAVVNETADDVKAAYHDDEIAIATIEEMEGKVTEIFHNLVRTVEDFYNTNKHLERKPYAILGQEELSKMHFGLAMTLYLGKEVDYKAFMIKHRKDYGIKDDPANVTSIDDEQS
jgi:T4 RnlA family RNA ligase